MIGPLPGGQAEHRRLLVDLAVAAHDGERRTRLQSLEDLQRLEGDVRANDSSCQG